MPLDTDYRPRTFDDVLGQDGTVAAIRSILGRENKDFPHAWLFEGPSGTGKTTLARIVARELGCDPKSMDFKELDIAQFSGVDTAREIRAAMRFLPTGKNIVKIYLLDEVHMGSRAFQNGLLKALEDAPSHVYFLLCSTEANKLIKTVLTRCTPFTTQLLTVQQMEQLINEVLAGEGIDDFDAATIRHIAEAAEGSPRSALKKLDKVLDVDPADRIDAIGAGVDEKTTKDLSRALLKNESWAKVAAILQTIKKGEEEQFRLAINGYMAKVLMNNKQIDPRALFIMTCFEKQNHYNGKPGLVFSCANVCFK